MFDPLRNDPRFQKLAAEPALKKTIANKVFYEKEPRST